MILICILLLLFCILMAFLAAFAMPQHNEVLAVITIEVS